MKTSEEGKKRDFIIELMEKEWERRVEVISQTRKLEPDDIVTIATLTLNREMGELAHEMGVIRKEMVTKKTLAWGLGVGLTIVTIVISLVTHFI